jgi:hypothetical protein
MSDEPKGTKESKAQTLSEALFEGYLLTHGIDFDYQPNLAETAKRPDYRIRMERRDVYFEVKQFDPPAGLPAVGQFAVGQFDPYEGTREKINKAREQLRGLKDPCALVLFNAGRPLVGLDPWEIYAAMLGDVVWRIPLDREKGELVQEETRIEFGSRGKMIRYLKGGGGAPEKPMNTTISAIVVLCQVRHGYRRLLIQDKLEGKPPTLEAMLTSFEAAKGTRRDPELAALRVVVHENPYGTRPLPAAFGNGPFDERYGLDGNKRLRRLFVGDQLAKLEAEEREAGIEDHDPFAFRG